MRLVKSESKTRSTRRHPPLDGIGGTAKFRDTIRQLIDLLYAQGVCVHGKVPSERRLEELTGVSRRTIRKAVLELDRLNVTRRVGPRTRMINEWARDFVEAPLEARTAIDDPDGPPLLRQTVLLVRHRLLPLDQDPEEFRGRPSHAGEAFQEYAYRHDRPVLQMRPGLLLRRPERELRVLPVSGAVLTEDTADLPNADELVRRLQRACIPLIVQSDSVSFPGVDTVRSDHEAGSYAVTQWLLSHAGRRLVRYGLDWKAKLPPSAEVWRRARRAGHRRAMVEAGLEPAKMLSSRPPDVKPEESREWFELAVGDAADRLGPAVERGLNAVILSSDALVGVAAAALRRLGVRPGEDVQLAGYDNFWRTYHTRRFEQCSPNVTVDKRHARMAAVALSLLDKRIEERQHGSQAGPAVIRQVTPRLVVI
jgi:DNA-binding LacI/PurR family transcriptional regulator